MHIGLIFKWNLMKINLSVVELWDRQTDGDFSRLYMDANIPEQSKC